MKTVYRYRVPEYGEQLVRLYTLANDKASTLGETPLPDGVVRLFRHNGHDGLSFVTAQSIKYVPIGDKIELNLGPDPEVVCEWIKQRVWRSHVWMHVDGTNVYRQVDDGAVQIEVNSSGRRLERTHVLTRSAFATTRPGPFTWSSAARCPATSPFARPGTPRCMTFRRSSIRRTWPPETKSRPELRGRAALRTQRETEQRDTRSARRMNGTCHEAAK